MVAAMFTYSPTPGGAIHREQIQAILGGSGHLMKPAKYQGEKDASVAARDCSGLREKKYLHWVDESYRGHRRVENARARREKHRPKDHTTIRHMH